MSIGEWLAEAPGELFKKGKWIFWVPMELIGTLIEFYIISTVYEWDVAKLYLAFAALIIIGIIGIAWYSTHPSLTKRLMFIGSIILLSGGALIITEFWIASHVASLRHAESKYDQDKKDHQQSTTFLVGQAKEIAGQLASAERARARAAENNRLQVEAQEETNRLLGRRRNGQQTAGKTDISANSGLNSLLQKIGENVDPPPQQPKESSLEFLSVWDVRLRILTGIYLGFIYIGMVAMMYGSAQVNAKFAKNDEQPTSLRDKIHNLFFRQTPKSSMYSTDGRGQRTRSRTSATPIDTDQQGTVTEIRSNGRQRKIFSLKHWGADWQGVRDTSKSGTVRITLNLSVPSVTGRQGKYVVRISEDELEFLEQSSADWRRVTIKKWVKERRSNDSRAKAVIALIDKAA